MLRMKGTACIDATPEATWNVLADIENIQLWSETVLSSACTGSQRAGVGAERTCQIGKKVTITERWVAWQEGESYTYEGFNLPLVKSAKNTWSVKEENGKTLLTTESEVVLKGGVLGKLLEPLMKWVSRKMGSNALASLKYYVENGKPFEGKHSLLPRAAISC